MHNANIASKRFENFRPPGGYYTDWISSLPKDVVSKIAFSILYAEIYPAKISRCSMPLNSPGNKSKVLDFKNVAPRIPSGKALKYLKSTPPYHYSNDMFFADLNVMVKEKNHNFPLIEVDTKKVRFAVQNNQEVNHIILENKYRMLAKVEAYSPAEKLSIIYLAKINFYLDEVIQTFFRLKPVSHAKNFKQNINLCVKECIKHYQIDLHKLNILIAIVVCYAVRGSEEPYTTPQWTKVLQAATSEWEIFHHIFNDFAHKHGLGMLTACLKSGPVNISHTESKMFMPMMTKSGMFGAETFLKLFFNKMIPYCANLTWLQSIHGGTIRTPYGILTHDIEHTLRTIPIMRDEKWFNFLHNCYKQILTGENFAASKRLIVYLFIIIHEMGITKEKVSGFESNLNQRYKIDINYGRIEYDDAFVKMLELVAKDDLTLENGKENLFVISVLSNLHEEFDRLFNMRDEAKSMIEQQKVCNQDSNHYYCTIL